MPRFKKKSKKSGWKQSVPRSLGPVRKGMQGGKEAVYSFTRETTNMVDLTALPGNDVSIMRADGTNGGGFLIRLNANAITDFGVDFPSLFAGYRFTAVEYTIYPGRLSANGGLGACQVMVHSVNNEFNTLGTIITQAQLDQFQSKKTRTLINAAGKPIKIKFKPTQQIAVASTNALTQARAVGIAGWIPTQELNVIHSGPCIVFQTLDNSLFSQSGLTVSVKTKFWFECKSVV